MQQMAGNMGLLNPFVLNQFSQPGAYSPYTQVKETFWKKLLYKFYFFATKNEIFPSFSFKFLYSIFSQYSPLNAGIMSQQAALMQAASQGYISPITGLPITNNPGLGGLTNPVVTSSSDPSLQPSIALSCKFCLVCHSSSYKAYTIEGSKVFVDKCGLGSYSP